MKNYYTPLSQLSEIDHKIFLLKKKLYRNKMKQKDPNWTQVKNDKQNEINKARRKNDPEWREKTNKYSKKAYQQRKLKNGV